MIRLSLVLSLCIFAAPAFAQVSEPLPRFEALERNMPVAQAADFDPAQRTLSFMVTECALVDACFDVPVTDRAAFTRDTDSGPNLIVTPSRWSRERLVEYGFDSERIVVVPHGVDAQTFRPLGSAERLANRRAMGVAEDEVLFLNVGVATWNKGLDLLIEAFAHVRRRVPRARLLLKENRALYGLAVDRTVAEIRRDRPGLIDEAVLGSISVISTSLDQAQLRALYGMADAYVSPYRAEGFNLPVLEAMACGTTALVTDGGPTDDFCPPALAHKLASRAGTRADAPQDVGPFRVPALDAIVEGMVALAERRGTDTPAAAAQREQARQSLVSRLSWPAVTDRLAALF